MAGIGDVQSLAGDVAAMNSLDFSRRHAGLVSAGMYATPPKWRLVVLAAAVCFGTGTVFGIMLDQGSPDYVSPNVCRADEVSRMDCMHVTAPAVPEGSGVAR